MDVHGCTTDGHLETLSLWTRLACDTCASLQTIERCITLLFIVDLCLNFNTAYLDGSHFIVDRSLIARNYLMGWFWIDLASSIPFEDLLHLLVLLTGNDEAFSGQPRMTSDDLG